MTLVSVYVRTPVSDIVRTLGICPRTCYAMSGTDMNSACLVSICLRACYEKPGTDRRVLGLGET
eukprot:1245986-Rhodomonas_salina.2